MYSNPAYRNSPKLGLHRHSLSQSNSRRSVDPFNHGTSTKRSSAPRNAIFGLLGLTSLYILYALLTRNPAQQQQSEPPVHTKYPLAKPFEHDTFESSSKLSCDLCVRDPHNELCTQYGTDSISASKSYLGTGARVKRFLQRAAQGESLKIGVIGGSISVGHGLQPGEPAWHGKFFDWLNSTTSGNHELYNGAQPASNAAYFSFCFPEHLPPNLDLYLVELDVNNEMAPYTLDATNDLYRTLLGLPSQPAVITQSIFSLSFNTIGRGEMYSSLMSQYLDIPVISIRNPLLPKLMVHPELVGDYFVKDYLRDDGTFEAIHINKAGHAYLGDMLTIYMKEQTCVLERHGVDKQITIPPLPRLHLTDKWSPIGQQQPIQPSCSSVKSKSNPLTPIAEHEGWELVEWHDKAAWASHTNDATITFEFEGSRVGIFHWTTSGEKGGVRDAVQPGSARCWVDDESEDSTTVQAMSTGAGTVMWSGLLRDNLHPGKHTLTCLTIQDKEFRIIGLGVK